jgi:hypothetical protein
MRRFYCLMMVLSPLLCARAASAEDIVVRLINVNSGAGERNCEVLIFLGDPIGEPRPGHTGFVRTSADGRARFSLTEPMPSRVYVDVPEGDCPLVGSPSGLFSVDEILRTGVTTFLSRDPIVRYCRPNFKKLEEITAKPGEVLIFVCELPWYLRFFRD